MMEIIRPSIRLLVVILLLAGYAPGPAEGASPKEWQDQFDRFYAREQYDQALLCIERALSLDQNDAEAWCSKGLALGRINRTDAALVCYEKALRIDPMYVDAWFAEGLELDRLDRRLEAIEKYDRVIDILKLQDQAGDVHSRALLYKGLALRALGRYDEAIECYDELIQEDSGGVTYRAEARNNKGMALLYLKKPKDALECFNQSIEASRNYSKLSRSALRNKGLALLILKRPEEALACLKDCTNSTGEDAWMSWFYRGIAQRSLQNDSGATGSFRRARELKSGGDLWAAGWIQDASRGISFMRDVVRKALYG